MIVVYDLDGTLSKVNTYKVFLIVLFLFLICTLQFKSIIRFLTIIRLRSKGHIDRFEMKCQFYFLEIEIKFKSQFENFLSGVLLLFLRKDILLFAKENVTILATAAYSFYSEKISEILDFDFCIATTPEDLNNGNECISDEKKKRVLDTINDEGIDLFFTDHKDDIPLILTAKKTYLVKPSKISLDAIKELHLTSLDYSYV